MFIHHSGPSPALSDFTRRKNNFPKLTCIIFPLWNELLRDILSSPSGIFMALTADFILFLWLVTKKLHSDSVCFQALPQKSTEMVITHISLSTRDIDKVDKDHTRWQSRQHHHQQKTTHTLPNTKTTKTPPHTMAKMATIFSKRQYIYTKMADCDTRILDSLIQQTVM